MTDNLEELARRVVPTFRVPSEGNGHAPEIDPITEAFQQDEQFAAQELKMTRVRSQTARMKAEAEADEIEALNRRDAAAMERQQLLSQRQMMMQPPPQPGGGGGGGEMVNALITLVTETQKDTRALMQQLTEKQNAELKTQLDSTREQLTAAIQRPPEDPVSTIDKYMSVFTKLQSIAPKTEPANAAAQSIRDVIELEQARNRMEIERLQFRSQFAENENEKARIQGDLQARQMRDWQMGKALNDAIPQLTAALTARITGTPWNPQPPPVGNGQRSWICPGFPGTADHPPRECGAENWDAAEAVEATCATCGTSVRLEPLELPPPPLLAPPPEAAPAPA